MSWRRPAVGGHADRTGLGDGSGDGPGDAPGDGPGPSPRPGTRPVRFLATPDGGPSAALVVELCGLPGAGKTTTAHELVARLGQRGCAAVVVDAGVSAAVPIARRVPRKVAMIGKAVATGPREEMRAARLLGTGQHTAREAVAVPAQWWVAEQLLVAARRRVVGTALVEEGLVQALWTAGLRSRRVGVADLVALASAAAHPDLVVHLDVSAEEAVERLRARPSRHSRVQRMPLSAQLAAMQVGEGLLRGVLDEWSDRGLSEVLRLPVGADDGGSDPLATLFARLLSRPLGC